MANYHPGLPTFDWEYASEFSETPADPYSSRGWTFETESEDSLPESDDFDSAFPMTSNIRVSNTMPRISQDFRHHSWPTTDQPCHSISPQDVENLDLSVWDDGEPLDWEFPRIRSRPPRFQAESSNSPKKAQKSTSSSTSSISQLHRLNRIPDWEAVVARHYDVENHQESRDAAETATSNDRPTSSFPSRRPKPYSCIFPECEASFARPYDLGRHQKSRHANSKRFDCPIESCRRYGSFVASNERGGFTRLDHFRDHVKNLHGKAIIKDKDGQYWVVDPRERDGELWMRDETGSIRTKDRLGRIRVKDAKTGRWQQL